MEHPIENEQGSDEAARHQSLNTPIRMYCLRETLNLHWDRYRSSDTGQVSEKITYEEPVNNGDWKFGAIDLGSAWLVFHERDLLINAPVLHDVGFRTRRLAGSSSERVWEAHQRFPSVDAQLTVKLRLFDNPVHFYIADDGKLMLLLSKGTSIETVGSGYDSALLIEHLKKQNGIHLPDAPPPTGALRGELIGQFSEDGLGRVIGFDACQSLMVADAKTFAEPTTSMPINISFSEDAFPEIAQNKPPQDMNCALSLFVPNENAVLTSGVYLPEAHDYVAQFYLRSAFSAPVSAALAAQKPSITPLLRQVYPGDEKQALTLERSNANAQWAFDGPSVGSLQNENGNRFYYPPPPLTPAATLEPNNKTNVPAALKADLEHPLYADVINATAAGQKATSTFLTQYIPETHFFKAHLVSGKVRLVMWYTKWGATTPIEVSAANTQWVRIAGNGNVDNNGVFSPASSQPTPFTVLLAKDVTKDDGYYYWAYIVLPLPILEPDKVLELING